MSLRITMAPPLVWRAGSLGALFLTGALAGCAGAGGSTQAGLPQASTPAGTRLAGAPKKPIQTMYVANRESAQILGFPSNATGNVGPTVVISGYDTKITNPVALALDAAGNIYAANDSDHQILIFPAGSNGDVVPQVLGGYNVPLTATEGIAIDASGQIYVSDFRADQILVFAPGSSGDVPPIRTISGPDTGLTDPVGMAFDSHGNLYVTNYNDYGATLVEFAPNANGDATPIGTLGIAGGGGKSTLFGAFNVVINKHDAIIVGNKNANAIDVFKKGAKGNVKPNQVIAGGETSIVHLESVGVDAQGYLYATNIDNYGNYSVLAFKPGAHGNVGPTRVLAGGATSLDNAFYPVFH